MPILFSVYTVELYSIQLRDVSVTKRQGPVHPDAQLQFWDLLFVCFFFGFCAKLPYYKVNIDIRFQLFYTNYIHRARLLEGRLALTLC